MRTHYCGELSEAILSSGVKVRWGAQASIGLARNTELLATATRSGLRTMFIGFEGIDRDALVECNKKNRPGEYGELVAKVHKAGAGIEGGAAGETARFWSAAATWALGLVARGETTVAVQQAVQQVERKTEDGVGESFPVNVCHGQRRRALASSPRSSASCDAPVARCTSSRSASCVCR